MIFATYISTSKSLFSRHYLTRRLPEHAEWAEDLTASYERLRELYAAKREVLPTLNEAQTEDEFIKPVLELLGFTYIAQSATHRGGRVQRPDYALFADAAHKADAYKFVDDEAAFYGRALAIAEAKYWERPLSEKRADDPRDEFKNHNPSFQIVNYLTGTGVDWGIMTNGRVWRLYYRLASSKATEFYEIDLVELLEKENITQFKYFWLFFRRAAFIRDAHERNFLERVREGCTTYASVVGEHLKLLVFEEIFPLLAGGFVKECTARGEDVRRAEVSLRIYEATLSLLYKILFMFYAEARNLLPINNPDYRALSLTYKARRLAALCQRGAAFPQRINIIYDRLLNLFKLVDVGEPALGVPRYNGGLFDPQSPINDFLLHHKLKDEIVAPALDMLYRVEGETVDYGYLDVRHLGAIYEGLLEHRLVIDDVERAAVHLETDKGERKLSGSYYTPDYVVKYIIRESVAPILAERAARFAELMTQIGEVRARLADPTQMNAVPALRNKLAKLEHEARETLLNIKVCDPAMGSGHFLVEAVDFLTDNLIEILNRYPQDNPVLKMLGEMRAAILANLAEQSITVDETRLNDTQLLQRVVMKRCVYGVDLNSMAVELSKVSLWLHSFTIGAPLSFLDHHLRCGNSLVGTLARDAEKEMRDPQNNGQATFLTGPFVGLLRAAEIMRGISNLSDATFAEVAESTRLFQEFDTAAQPYKRLLDIYVAHYFGVKHAQEFLTLYGREAFAAMQDDAAKIDEPYRTALAQTRELSAARHFFHWDLEFPEVFVDLERATWMSNPGFDAVVGNPPYVDVAVDDFYRSRYTRAATRNLYAYMMEKAESLGQRGSRLGMIVPLSLVCSERMAMLREMLKENYANIRVANFSKRPAKVFPEAEQRVSIVLGIKKTALEEPARLESTKLNRWHYGEEWEMMDSLMYAEITDLPHHLGWPKLGGETERGIAHKLFLLPSTIGDYLNGEWRFYYHGVGQYWLKAYDFLPTYLKATGKPGMSSTLFELFAQSEQIGKTIIALINSSLFYWYWNLYSDDFHLNKSEIYSFPFTFEEGHHQVYRELGKAVDELMRDYQDNSVLKRGRYAKGYITWQEFYPRQSKHIIDHIDDLLGMIYGLSAEETAYIKNYEISFRTDE